MINDMQSRLLKVIHKICSYQIATIVSLLRTSADSPSSLLMEFTLFRLHSYEHATFCQLSFNGGLAANCVSESRFMFVILLQILLLVS